MKNLFKLGAMLALVFVLSGCNCFKKMAKNLDLVEVKCTPEVLQLNNGKVEATVAVTLPEEYFNEKAIVKVTPVMVYEGGETAATPFFYQGAEVEDNYKVITGSVTEKIEFKYNAKMRISELQLRVEVKCKDEFELINLNTGDALSKSQAATLAENPTSKEALAILKECGYTVAKGVNTLQQDIKQELEMTMMDSNYKRVTNSVEKSDLIYAISSSQLSYKATKSDDVANFVALVDANSKNDRATQKLSAQGYASPDGPEKFNDKLAAMRSESGKKAMVKLLKSYGLTIDASSYGEDWDGFKAAVEASDIEDKNLILQVLSLYNSSTQREEEIKNLSAVYSELKNDVLPTLRRTQMVNSVDLVGKSDEEMLALVESKSYDELNALEILHICNELKVKTNVKVALLSHAAKKYNNGPAYNNLGVLQAKSNKAKPAIASFNAASENDAKASEVSRNLTLAYLMQGNVAKAKSYSEGIDAPAKSLIAAAQGNYKPAAKELKGYNKAIALFMLGNLDGANKAIAKDKSADAMYLKAVISSTKGDVKTAETQLRAAVKKSKGLAKKAQSDVNLANLFESGFKF